MTKHRTFPWSLVGQQMPAFDDDIGNCMMAAKDWSQANDLSKEMPDMLHKLQRLFPIESSSNTTSCRWMIGKRNGLYRNSGGGRR
ncbi:MAG: hypothetical protein M5U34_13465 [Chloroflexi bacterium]|nr:hypothetical protein [Chloroflexota bacterium]